MKNIRIAILIPILSITACALQKENPEITTQEIYDHIQYIASDEFEGRYPGTKGDSLSVDYIVSALKKSGFSKENIVVQEFEVITGIKNLGGNKLTLGTDIIPDSLYAPFPFSDAGNIEGELVFVGYGFQIEDKNTKWDDYANINANGKIVVALRGEPYIDSTASVFRTHSTDINKALTAKDNGAKGIILVSGPAFDAKDEMVELKGKNSNAGIPAVQLKRDIANSLLKNNNVGNIENKLNVLLKPVSFELSITSSIILNLEIDKRTTYNVIATLDAPNNTDKNLLVGAHYDHLGMGGEGTSSRRRDTVAVHNGADDNGSGVVAVLEIAEKAYANKDMINRNLLFAFFGAEEMGLLGSKHYIESPDADITIEAMINLDMVGRLKADSSLQIGGVGTSLESRDILKTINENYGFNITMSDAGYGPSDHASFYAKDIPVFFISSGAHPDYHTPEDDIDSLNLEGIKMIADFASDILFDITARTEKLTFQEAGPKEGQSSGRRFKVALGIMPDFTSTENNGLGVDFVTPGKPGHLGGMKKGDLITEIDGKPIKTIHEYMFRMSKYNVGDRITVTVKRNEKEEVLLIQL